MMKKKIVFIILSIFIVAIGISFYVLSMRRIHFKPKITYSICVWGDTSAVVDIEYVMSNGDSNVIVREKNLPIVHQKSQHALEKWNMITLKPVRLINDQKLPSQVIVSGNTKSKIYVAVFNNDSMPLFMENPFLVMHVLMLRSAYDDNPDVAQKTLDEWMLKSSFLQSKSDSTKINIAKKLWTTMQQVNKDSIAQYLTEIHYPLFKVIDAQHNNVTIYQ